MVKVLFVYDDGPTSSFFVYDLKGRENGLLRVAPEIPINGLTLGELYTQVPIEKFVSYFAAAFSLDVTKFLILQKKDSLAAIKAAGLDPQGKMLVTVEKAFTSELTGQRFVPGEMPMTLADIAAYIHYQIDEDGRLDVFTRQEDIIRLMKRKTVRPSLAAITQNLGTVKEFSASNLGLKDMLKLGSGYLAKGDRRMKKTNVPEFGTYQVSGEMPRRITAIDWTQNVIQLRPELRG